jgi:dihydropteroate synthase
MSEPRFAWGSRTYVMGIVNVTPDSFSGDGLVDPPAAVAHGQRLVSDGADLLDVGGESTRPGAHSVGVEEERRRVVPVIEALAAAVDVPLSVDTYRAAVAEEAIAAGARMVNDVWGFTRDPELAQVVARSQVFAIAMHNRRSDTTRHEGIGGYVTRADYQDLVAEICQDLRHSVEILVRAGVPEERIILDPGIGFGKTPTQNLEVLRRLGEIKALGFPLLLGTSRKSFIGLALGLPPEERVEGTAATVALGIREGADLVRVHDLPAMARVARMADVIVRGLPLSEAPSNRVIPEHAA